MDRVLHHQARLGCGPERAFALFTTKAGLESWLAPRAEVEPRVGGRYELYWDPAHPEDNSTIGCKVTVFVPDQLLAFDWKGPVQFRPFMNAADPLTHVTVCFIPSAHGTEVHLVCRTSGDGSAGISQQVNMNVWPDDDAETNGFHATWDLETATWTLAGGGEADSESQGSISEVQVGDIWTLHAAGAHLTVVQTLLPPLNQDVDFSVFRSHAASGKVNQLVLGLEHWPFDGP